jgi:gluconolactonase
MVKAKLTRRDFIFSMMTISAGSIVAAKPIPTFAPESAIDEIIDPSAKLEKLAGGFLFTEGPASDAKGNVYFTDQPNDRIMIWNTEDKLSVFMTPCGHSNGMKFDKNGNLWTCADEKNEFWCISPEMKVKVIQLKYQGKQLNGPNDLWIAPCGGIYFTDPFYKRTWWDHDTMPQDYEAVYYLNRDNSKITRVVSDLIKPNGIVGTPDGKKLYIADIAGNITWLYSIADDGSLSDKREFCKMGSDGMTIDSNGNIYLTGRGVTVFTPGGTLIGNIPVPEEWTANVSFGGSGMNSLFITAGKSLYRIHTKMKGIC